MKALSQPTCLHDRVTAAIPPHANKMPHSGGTEGSRERSQFPISDAWEHEGSTGGWTGSAQKNLGGNTEEKIHLC